MMSLPEQYRMPAIAAAILLLAVGVAVATRTPAADPAPVATETVSDEPAAKATTTVPAAAPTKPAPAPTKKPAPKPTTPTSSAPQSATNPSAIGNTPTIVTNELKLSVLQSSYGAELSWTPSYQKDLKGIIVVKSTVDPNPYYPKQPWSMFRPAGTGNNTWQDRQLEKGKKTYYRVCGFHTDDTLFCGNVVSVTKQ